MVNVDLIRGGMKIQQLSDMFAVLIDKEFALLSVYRVFDLHSTIVITSPVGNKSCLRFAFDLFFEYMNNFRLFALLSIIAFVGLPAFGQKTVVVIDPTKPVVEGKIGQAEDDLFHSAMPAVKRQIGSETCTGEVERAGVAHGSFSKPGAKQTLVFYQFCQTGNGLGWVGLVLMENGKVIGNYVSDSGWSLAMSAIPDINKNGLDEFTLSFGGGMHQGEGGVGVDLMEFSGNMPKALGWFQTEKFMDTQATTVWKITAKPGKVPAFYKQKFDSTSNETWKKVGVNTALKLTKTSSSFTEVK